MGVRVRVRVGFRVGFRVRVRVRVSIRVRVGVVVRVRIRVRVTLLRSLANASNVEKKREDIFFLSFLPRGDPIGPRTVL